MNKTKIDWADMTWNPVTGCNHGCEYCYARKIANRFGNRYLPYGNGLNNLDCPVNGEHGIDPYPFGFEPTFHRYRLDEPAKIKKPQTIFVCSMADLFGEWVPDEWIQQVFDACKKAPWHRYLFLTKNPKRYREIYKPFLNDFFYGASASNQVQLKTMEKIVDAFSVMYRSFLSIEPIREQIRLTLPVIVDWVIIGAETGNSKGKVIPEKAWIDAIVLACKASNVPIFMKESLRSLMGTDFIQEYPWGGIR